MFIFKKKLEKYNLDFRNVNKGSIKNRLIKCSKIKIMKVSDNFSNFLSSSIKLTGCYGVVSRQISFLSQAFRRTTLCNKVQIKA